MAIAFSCSCGRKFRVKPEHAGKRFKCPGCGQTKVVPAETAPAPPKPEATPAIDKPREAKATLRPAAADQSAAMERYRHILEKKDASSWRDYSYWLLLLALIPLVFSLLAADEDDLPKRFWRTVDHASPAVQDRVDRLFQKQLGGPGKGVAGLAEDKDDSLRLEDLIPDLPHGRIEGAHLPRKTWLHWLYGLLAAGLFFGLTLLVLPDSEQPLHFFFTGLFTGTIGILFLFLAQLLAAWTQGRILVSRNIFILLLFWIAWAIGFSYRAALDIDTSFIPSFLGFTFGVGLCEEAVKALPLIWAYRALSGGISWRRACTWGFASGAGFGVAEGIMYAADFYNGIAPAGTYVVRFVSCVALHGIWTAAVALFMHKHQEMIQAEFQWLDFIPRVVFLVSVPMILHGLYDTFLKKELNGLALVVALASFAWLAWRMEVARREEEPVGKASHA